MHIGSVARRQAPFRFDVAVDSEDVDTTLEEQLKAEIPRILLKAVRCYLWTVQTRGNDEFWYVHFPCIYIYSYIGILHHNN